MRHATSPQNNPKHTGHYTHGLGNGNGHATADDLPNYVKSIHQYDAQHHMIRNHPPQQQLQQQQQQHAYHRQYEAVPPPVIPPYETFHEAKATELTLSTLIGLLVFLVPVLVALSLFVHRIATGMVPNPNVGYNNTSRRSFPRSDSTLRRAQCKKDDGWSQDEEEMEDGGNHREGRRGGGVDGGGASKSYWGESGARLRKKGSETSAVGDGSTSNRTYLNPSGTNASTTAGGVVGGTRDYNMYSSRSSSPDRPSSSMFLSTSTSTDDSPTRRRHSNHVNSTSTNDCAVTRDDPGLDIGLGLDGFGMYARSVSMDSESLGESEINNTTRICRDMKNERMGIHDDVESRSSSTASSPSLPLHQPQHLRLSGKDSFDNETPKDTFQFSSTSYSSSSWNDNCSSSTSTTPLSTNRKTMPSPIAMKADNRTTNASHKEKGGSQIKNNHQRSESPPFLPPISDHESVSRTNPPPPPPPPLLPPTLHRSTPKLRQKTEELLSVPSKSTHDIQMGDGTTESYHSSDVSCGDGEDGTSSIASTSIYSVDDSNFHDQDDSCSSTPLVSNMHCQVGDDHAGNMEKLQQFVSLPTLEASNNAEDQTNTLLPLETKKIIAPVKQNEVKRSNSFLDVEGISSPRSISVEELKLFRMESGLTYPKSSEDRSEWKTSIKSPQSLEAVQENESTVKETVDSKVEQILIQEDTRQDTGDLSNGETEGANGILHKRKDLTASTDAASSLKSSIAYKELKMKTLIGGGGFGQVWEATWRGTPVAVKVLAASSQTENVQKAILQEFAAEINMVSGMRHPNICLYIGACLEHPNRCIITELAANGSLWDALRQSLQPPYYSCDGVSRNGWPSSLYNVSSPEKSSSETATFYTPVPFEHSWPWMLVRRVAAGAARGMNYLHCGHPAVLHRDLKSANILLDDSYNAKVCDFGLSRLKAKERSMTGNCGTVQWMAPEILANQHYAEPADVYSYGIILWELLSRECPYGEMSPIQCALAVLNQDLRPTIPEWCPPAFGALIKKCIDKDPNARPTFENILCILDSM